MLTVLSPAKALNYKRPAQIEKHTFPEFILEAAELIAQLRSLSPASIASLMSLSDSLTALNVARYANWSPVSSHQNAKQALLAFDGDVYEGMNTPSLTAADLDFAQNSIRILSGLYGVLRPLDLMQPYRLEMGTHLANEYGKNLYDFWGDRVTNALNALLAKQKTPLLLNLASHEYFKVIKRARLRAPIITPVFEDWTENARGGAYKIISFYAKRARGMMARYIIDHRIEDVQQLKKFSQAGYAFSDSVSSEDTWVFRRVKSTP